MERKIITDNDLDLVVGGSIVVSPDHTTCGRDCTNQYKVLDFDSLVSYVATNSSTMSERKMLSNMVALGYIAAL